jgi:dipeptidyl aminopeptidase/acylaminoacyl peptidase
VNQGNLLNRTKKYYFVGLMAIVSWLMISALVGNGCVKSKALPPSAVAADVLQPGQEVEFKARFDGGIQKYIIRLPRDFKPNKEHDLMIGLHGHGSDRHQFAQDDRGECRGARDVAGRHRMIFVSPDYREKTSWMGPAAEADMVQLIGDLKRQYKIRMVYIVGASMGGTAALTFAALHPDLVDGVCSLNGMANLLEYTVDVAGIQEAIKNSFGGRPDETPDDYKKRNPDEYKKRSAEFHPGKFTMSLAITASGQDGIVPPDSVLRLAEAVQKHNPRVFVIHRPQEGHLTSYEDTVIAIMYITEPHPQSCHPDNSGSASCDRGHP